MKPKFVLVIFLFFYLTQLPLFSQQDNFIKDYLERWENSKKYLLLVAEVMPGNKYHFKATPESKTFAENLMHLGYAMDWHSQTLIGGRKPRDYHTDTTFQVGKKSKKEMIALISKTFDEATKIIKEFKISQFDIQLDYLGLQRTKRQIFLLLADHVTHHRAQMLVYMRLNGLVPPRYIKFQ